MPQERSGPQDAACGATRRKPASVRGRGQGGPQSVAGETSGERFGGRLSDADLHDLVGGKTGVRGACHQAEKENVPGCTREAGERCDVW